MKYFGYIYITTNTINGKQYIGQHISDTFDKNYKGSGIKLKEDFVIYPILDRIPPPASKRNEDGV